MLASHNSGTGEYSGQLLDVFLLPFYCTQAKTIEEQLRVGVRYFDLRIRYDNETGEWLLTNGLWKSISKIDHSLITMTVFGRDIIYVDITNDCLLKRDDSKFINKVLELKKDFPKIQIVNIYSKALFRKRVNINNKFGNGILTSMPYKIIDNYPKLDKSDWKSIIPLPAFWSSVIDYNRHKCDTKTFEFKDFV